LDEQLLRIFQSELRTQCEFIVIGGRQLDAFFHAEQEGDSIVVWFAIQGMLVSAANASKLLWGSKAEPVLQARRLLRESVGVTDDSPLSSRQLRNDFEHFDERLEDWFAASANHIYIGRAIGPPNLVAVGDQAPDDQFGHYDPSTSVVSFWERSVLLSQIFNEAKRILSILPQ